MYIRIKFSGVSSGELRVQGEKNDGQFQIIKDFVHKIFYM